MSKRFNIERQDSFRRKLSDLLDEYKVDIIAYVSGDISYVESIEITDDFGNGITIDDTEINCDNILK